MRFVGIKSLVMGKDAVIGETAWTSTKDTPEAAAADITRKAKLGKEVTVTAHAKNPYQHNVSVDGKLAFRLLDAETAPKSKIKHFVKA